VIATATPGEYDLVAFVHSLDSPPLLVGHSQGGLVAQLAAAHTPSCRSGTRERNCRSVLGSKA
jgi:pimeloyl-ACP methyl ester carboxylesterase